MLVLEIAHAHATGDIACDAVLKQLDIRDFFCFGKEVFYLAFGGGEFSVCLETPYVFCDDVVVPEAHIDRAVFFGDELQKFYVGVIVVRDIARDAASIRRQEVALEEGFEMFAQHRYCAGHWHVEIDVQVADKKVSHLINLYSHYAIVK